MYYFAQHQTEMLNLAHTVKEEMSALLPDRGESVVRGILGAFLFSGDAADKKIAVLSGGELSSPVTGNGVGGRNSAFVLECVAKIAGKPIAVLSAGTDGIDGNSPAAGAGADG